jgi:hypothetical protein
LRKKVGKLGKKVGEESWKMAVTKSGNGFENFKSENALVLSSMLPAKWAHSLVKKKIISKILDPYRNINI